MKKTQILMNKPIYLGLPILELSKTSIKKLWYAYVNLKCGGKQNFVIWRQIALLYYVKSNRIYKAIVDDAELSFDTAHCELKQTITETKKQSSWCNET